MIKVSVMYPNKPGARFNHEYYRDKHMPLVKTRMGDSCKYYTVDKGLAGGAPGAPATYVGMCHIFCESVEAFQAGFSPHAKEIMADIPNYTDQAPVIQISEVVVGGSGRPGSPGGRLAARIGRMTMQGSGIVAAASGLGMILAVSTAWAQASPPNALCGVTPQPAF